MSAGVVEGEVENNSFGDRGNCKCPPYTIQTEAGLSEDHGKWDSGTGETMLMILQSFVIPRPESAPMVISSMVIKVSLNPMMIR